MTEKMLYTLVTKHIRVDTLKEFASEQLKLSSALCDDIRYSTQRKHDYNEMKWRVRFCTLSATSSNYLSFGLCAPDRHQN